MEQIAYRVGVFPPVQAMDRGPARIGVGRRDLVERRLQRGGHPYVGRPIGPRPPHRRHRPGAQLADDVLPCLGVVTDPLQIYRIQSEASRPEPLVVAGEAVAIQDYPHSRDGGRLGESTLRTCRAQVWVVGDDRREDEPHHAGGHRRRNRPTDVASGHSHST